MTETQQDLMAFEKLTKMKESFFKEIVFFDVFFDPSWIDVWTIWDPKLGPQIH